MTDQGALESQLAGLEAQREKLAALIGSDPQSPLIPLQNELAVAIDGIHQRLSSLLRTGEAKEVQHQRQEGQGQGQAATTASPTSPSLPPPEEEEEEEEEGAQQQQQQQQPPIEAVVGALCLAPRVYDRRHARAVVEGVDSSKGTCLVTWLHPRQRGELVCRYWKEGRSCKFSGPDCPFSHGVEVSLSSLLPFDDWRHPQPATAMTTTTASRAAGAAGDAAAAAAGAAWLLKGEQGESGEDQEPSTTTKTSWDTSASAATQAQHADNGGSSGGGNGWRASLHSGSRVLARYHDRLWYEATIAEGPATEAGGSVAVRFKGFEDDGPVKVPGDSSHLAPLEAAGPAAYGGGGGGGGRGRRRGRGGDAVGGGGGGGGSEGGFFDSDESDEEEESDLEDAWAADAARGNGDGRDGGDMAEKFFQERVLGDRRGLKLAGGGDGGTDGGLCSDAYVFGDWEQHTKGFGSLMMNRMGYRRGEGLGKEKQGISRPIPIRVLPERRALDHLRVEDGGAAVQRAGSSSGGGGGKKKSKVKKEGSNGTQDGGGGGGMFHFLNKTMHTSMNKRNSGSAGGTSTGRSSLLLGRQTTRPLFDEGGSSPPPSGPTGDGGATHPLRKSGIFSDQKRDRGCGEGGGGGGSGRAAAMSEAELRSHLVGAREAEATLAAKIGRLEETISRNSERDPRTAAQAKQKLEEVRLQAKEVRASRGRAERMLENRGLDLGGGRGIKGGKKGGGKKKGGMFSF